MLIWGLFASILSFQIMSFFFKYSNVSAINTRWSAKSNTQRQPTLNSLDKTSIITMKSTGLSTAPWWEATSMLNSSLNWRFSFTWNLAISCNALTASITYSSIPIILIPHQSNFLNTQSKSFSKSTKAKYRSLCLPGCSSCNWHRMKIASVKRQPGILLISTWDLIT